MVFYFSSETSQSEQNIATAVAEPVKFLPSGNNESNALQAKTKSILSTARNYQSFDSPKRNDNNKQEQSAITKLFSSVKKLWSSDKPATQAGATKAKPFAAAKANLANNKVNAIKTLYYQQPVTHENKAQDQTAKVLGIDKDHYQVMKEDYFCDLAATARENCELQQRSDESMEICLKTSGYFTNSRQCGYLP